MKNRFLILTLVFAICSLFVIPQSYGVKDSKSLQYLFVITGDSGEYKDGELTIKGVPIVSFNYLGPTREVGHFLVGTFISTWEKNSAIYKASPPSGTLSVLDQEGSVGAVIQVTNPTSTLNSLTFDAKVLEGEVPASFNASSLFLELNVSEKLETQN